jgi:hypothetical protein
MKELSIIAALILTSCLSLGIISDNNNPGFSAVAQTNKTKTQTVAANNLSTTTNTTKPSSSIQDTFSESGTINSLIYLSSDNNNSTLGGAKKFILFGDWNLVVNKGVVKDFQAKFINVLPDGTRWHTHGLVNLETDNITKIHLNGDNSVSIYGTVDIKLDDSDAWKGVKTNIIISKGNLISIFLDDLTTGDHFRGQPIYGTVQSIKDGNGNEIKKMVEKQITT